MATAVNQQNKQDLIQEVLSLSNDAIRRYDIHSIHYSSENDLTLEASRNAIKVIWVYDFTDFTFLKNNLPPAKSQWLGNIGWIYIAANKLVNIRTSILPSFNKPFNAEQVTFPRGFGNTHGVITCDNHSVLCLNPLIVSENEWTCKDIHGNILNICQWLGENQVFKYLIK